MSPSLNLDTKKLYVTLQYCIEQSFKLKRPLIVICLDYSKAFDSINRDTIIIETLIHFKINYKIIEAVANIYQTSTHKYNLESKEK